MFFAQSQPQAYARFIASAMAIVLPAYSSLASVADYWPATVTER